MGSQVPHLLKYMEHYTKLYPRACLILVKSPQALAFQGHSSRKASVAPAIDLLKREGMFGPHAPSLLVHAFSNGGGFQLVELSHMLRDTEIVGPRPPVAIIFDSMPGLMDLRGTFRALTAPVKSKPLKYVIFLPFAFVYYAFAFVALVTRTVPMIDALRNSLNEERLLPWTTKNTPRLYIFSDTDKLVQHGAVLEHIVQANGLGLNVKGVEFKGSPHVAHVRQDPETYWKAVEDTWNEATRGSVEG
ncbi:hypothetical protein FIBSPDRAFT_780474 [Athelia psychrophila]|uniref:DUF829-domain-containing protein n=1 Tax=Athelia psychrophila TaxID=1759441 RepID=A0A166R6U5_9AGAM|nr:hypothetical protein FIBSPDRAFT_780474 [Fibularhizoctonia sp. CBS 109695]